MLDQILEELQKISAEVKELKVKVGGQKDTLDCTIGGKHVLNTKETAELLRVSEQKVRKMVRQKKIPHKHLGNKIIYPVSGLQDWLNDQEKDEEIDSFKNAKNTIQDLEVIN